ncbi:zinc finger protein OZF-like [Mastacembelus armatus]|uniref:zinc finger protein OZF-like n=1 Tax=Mastacembelus armatus TaxID=205130 RepID=UPI0014367D12|nr:zinc finger protein OZF-like [Mastacembelus armatus]
MSTGIPAVPLYTSQTALDPAALSVPVLSSAVATGQSAVQPSASLVVTSRPLHNLSSVPVNLSQGAAASLATAAASDPTANSQETLNLQRPLGATGQDADTGWWFDTAGTHKARPVDLSQVNSEPHNQLKQHLKCHNKPFFCDQCHKHFHKEKTLHLTFRPTERKQQACRNVRTCGSRSDKHFGLQKKLDTHLDTHHEAQKKSFSCCVCQKTYSKMHLLKRHKAVHTRARPFICDTCGKGFTTKSVLQEHRSIYTGEKPFPCATCGKRFRTSTHLFSYRRVHSDERPFSCFNCEKTFKLKRALEQHHVIHTGETPFICQMCEIGCGLKNNLQRHLRIHTGEKPFRHGECGEEFSGTWAFKTHMLVHGGKKPFMCYLCGKTFFYNSKLLEHQHTVHQDQETAQIQQTEEPAGLKSFSCVSCQKRFCSADTLRVHDETHSEGNKFICSTYGKSFHRKCTFVYHMRLHSCAV